MFHRNNPKYTSNSISTLFKKWTSNGTGKGVYLWCHTLWKQSQTVFDVVYTWIEKNKIKEVSLYYKISPQPSLYKRRRNTLHWLPWGRKVMQVASRHHCYKNRHKRIGVFWATLQVACWKVEKTDFLFFFVCMWTFAYTQKLLQNKTVTEVKAEHILYSNFLDGCFYFALPVPIAEYGTGVYFSTPWNK